MVGVLAALPDGGVECRLPLAVGALVVEELRNSPFDGVMADNDVENDYYGLNLPIQGVESITTIRQHLDFLISFAGIELNKIGKILVPNIAESRLRWANGRATAPTAADLRKCGSAGAHKNSSAAPTPPCRETILGAVPKVW